MLSEKKYCSTRHGAKRTKERVGISKKLADKNAERAHLYGVHQREVKGSLRRYVDLLFFQSRHLSEIRIYNSNVYLFAGDRLITVMPVPQKYRKTAMELQKKHNSEADLGPESNPEACRI